MNEESTPCPFETRIQLAWMCGDCSQCEFYDPSLRASSYNPSSSAIPARVPGDNPLIQEAEEGIYWL